MLMNGDRSVYDKRPSVLLPPNDRTRSWVCASSDELSRGTIAEGFVRVNLVVVGDPARQLAEDALGVRSRADADVVAFDGAHEGLGHSVGLGALEGCGPWFQAETTGEGSGLAGDVA